MKYGAILLIAIMVGSVAIAQQQTADEVVRGKANLGNIDVIVKDKKGKYIPDLKAEDYTIVENGVAQKIEFFDAPLSRTETKSSADSVPLEIATTTSSAARPYVLIAVDTH